MNKKFYLALVPLALLALAARLILAESKAPSLSSAVSAVWSDGRSEAIERTYTMSMTDSGLRLANDSSRSEIHMDLSKKMLVMVSHNSKTYYEVTFEEIASARKALIAELSTTLDRVKGSGSTLEKETAEALALLSWPDSKQEVSVEGAEPAMVEGYGLAYKTVGDIRLEYPTTAKLRCPEFDALIDAYAGIGMIPEPSAKAIKALEVNVVSLTFDTSFVFEEMRFARRASREDSVNINEIVSVPEPAVPWAVPDGYSKVASPLAKSSRVSQSVPPGGVHDGAYTETEFD